MGLFKRKPTVDPAEVAALRAEMTDLRTRLEMSEAAKIAAERDSMELTSAFAQLRDRVDAAAAQKTALDELEERLSRTSSDATATRELVGLLEARVAQVSTELANQLAELGREMDGLSSKPPAPAAAPPTNEVVVEQLREGQVRLANEQARYEIAFREDLALLAEQVRLLRGR
jgi:exonuclease VII large subunit